MKWLLLLALLVLALVVIGLMLRARPGPGAPVRRRCPRCHGTGWIGGRPERTLDFDGEGFTDRHAPATMCPACGGTGSRPAP